MAPAQGRVTMPTNGGRGGAVPACRPAGGWGEWLKDEGLKDGFFYWGQDCWTGIRRSAEFFLLDEFVFYPSILQP
jgi:hypothetical protein